MTFRFVHAADLHLDSPFTGIRGTNPQVAETLRHATLEAFENIINLCIDGHADALLVAGDVFDSAERSLPAQLNFLKGLGRLNEAGIRAFICHGNHDPLSGWTANPKWPPNVTRFMANAETVPVFPARNDGPLVCGISYPERDVHTSLVPKFPEPEPGRFTIGLLHANVGGDSAHAAYSPCTVQELAAKGYDYWALGHIHTQAILRNQGPMIVYSGNTQGRHPNEDGAKGVYVVDVANDGDITANFVAVDVVRWLLIEADIEGVEDEIDLLEQLGMQVERAVAEAAGRHLVYRLRLHGRGPVHAALAREDAVNEIVGQLNANWAATETFAFCGGAVDRTKSELDREELSRGSDFVADLLELSGRTAGGDALLAELQEELAKLYRNSRSKRYLEDSLPAAADISGILESAEDLVLDLLTDE